jgi:hypothetical protein
MSEQVEPEPIYERDNDQDHPKEDMIRESSAADWAMTTVELPVSVYEDLRMLAADEQVDPVQMLARLVTTAQRRRAQRHEVAAGESERGTGNALQGLLSLATDLGVDDLSEQHDHYLYGTEKK